MADPYAQPSFERHAPTHNWSASDRSDPHAGEPDGTRNGFATASLLLGIIGVFTAAAGFGIAALVHIRQRRQRGRGMAIAGLVLSGAWAVGIVAAIMLTVIDLAERDSDGTITDGGDVSVMSVHVGVCFVNLEEAAEISRLPAVPCSEPHVAEVFGVFDLPEGEWPGMEAIGEQADSRCAEILIEYSSTAYEDPGVGLFHLHPLESMWPRDREIVCIAYALDGAVTGSYADR
ncbi:DUF4190 domain-containing protein [Phytoactinopolyspora halotolerans]|uniref:DUF4190 domain-containing protein n=1 Tax=Phytoactinopolyspora halotolerans TaxID=1981512 RepID=A0A6L9SFH5_9ACTN|nr:DUF4190 domain-containing protein [Phytoactinopolyspora halotolerans]NEE03394.1 DUF4190 domain-containing protein [Phytoactinopolyspora halotolerans]